MATTDLDINLLHNKSKGILFDPIYWKKKASTIETESHYSGGSSKVRNLVELFEKLAEIENLCEKVLPMQKASPCDNANYVESPLDNQTENSETESSNKTTSDVSDRKLQLVGRFFANNNKTYLQSNFHEQDKVMASTPSDPEKEDNTLEKLTTAICTEVKVLVALFEKLADTKNTSQQVVSLDDNNVPSKPIRSQSLDTQIEFPFLQLQKRFENDYFKQSSESDRNLMTLEQHFSAGTNEPDVRDESQMFSEGKRSTITSKSIFKVSKELKDDVSEALMQIKGNHKWEEFSEFSDVNFEAPDDAPELKVNFLIKLFEELPFARAQQQNSV